MYRILRTPSTNWTNKRYSTHQPTP